RAALSGFLLAQGHRWLRGVKVVVSDGSGSYRSAIAQHLGHATHVLDRFHVARWFAAGMIEVRRRIQRIAPKDHARHSNRPSSGPGICSSPASTTSLTTASKPWGGSWPTGPNWKRPGGCSSTSTASTSPKTQTRPTRRSERSSTSTSRHRWWSSTGSSKRSSSGETRLYACHVPEHEHSKKGNLRPDRRHQQPPRCPQTSRLQVPQRVELRRPSTPPHPRHGNITMTENRRVHPLQRAEPITLASLGRGDPRARSPTRRTQANPPSMGRTSPVM